jgi:hypothetical protein
MLFAVIEAGSFGLGVALAAPQPDATPISTPNTRNVDGTGAGLFSTGTSLL